MAPSVFDDFVRTNAKIARHDEGRFAFLNRSASRYFSACRDLIDEWFGHVPAEHQPDLRGKLRSEIHHRSAFWELYLHEAYRRSGYHIAIHPDVPGRPTHPDFLVSRDNERFYLEAVTVGRNRAEIAEEARLAQVHQLLTDLLLEDFSIGLSTYSVGPRPLATRRLRAELRDWIGGLDPDAVSAAVEASPSVGFDRLPELHWNDDGWVLVFHAVPLGEWARGVPRPALGMMGPGEATLVDNVTGLNRVIESKKNKYGPLEAPLVIAVQSRTEIPTRDYEVERALYGASTRRPAETAPRTDISSRRAFGLARADGRTARSPRSSPFTSWSRGVWPTPNPAAGPPSSRRWSSPSSPGGSLR